MKFDPLIAIFAPPLLAAFAYLPVTVMYAVVAMVIAAGLWMAWLSWLERRHRLTQAEDRRFDTLAKVLAGAEFEPSPFVPAKDGDLVPGFVITRRCLNPKDAEIIAGIMAMVPAPQTAEACAERLRCFRVPFERVVLGEITVFGDGT